MKKFFCTFFLCLLAAVTLSVSARAAEDILKVGLYYGSTALPAANLENHTGSGYALGWFDEDIRAFHQIDYTSERKLTIRAAGRSLQVTATDTGEALFAFDCSGGRYLGIMPDGQGAKAQTWCKGYRWYGGFEYRPDGSGVSVTNVVSLEDYVKGVLPYEMSPVWPLEALKAQAVCARTYALLPSRHYAKDRFDLCNSDCCQVYRGVNLSSAATDQAVEETAGMVAFYNGKYAETYYCSSNGGASESSVNIWLNHQPYLVGKPDPYEKLTDIPDYEYTIHYSWKELTALLAKRGYAIGTVTSAQVTKTTPVGNVSEITFRDASGKTAVLTKEDCRWALNAKSMRFTITGGSGAGGWSVNRSGEKLSSLSDAYVLSRTGLAGSLDAGSAYVITASGTSPLQTAGVASGGDGITVTGTGWGHGVGMSQYGAKAMAEQGHPYQDILEFYYTGIQLQRIG